MSSILLLTIPLRYFMSSLVWVEVCIPDVEEIYFYLFVANRIRIFICCSFWYGITVVDMHYLLNYYKSVLSAGVLLVSTFYGTPFHLTNPPQTDLDALPEPSLANSDNSASPKTSPKRPFKATARQAKPEAEEAMPEAVGKELTDST